MTFTDESWRSKMQGASAEIDARFGEALTIVPAKPRRANYQAEHDADHAVTLTGVFSYRSIQVFDKDPIHRQQGGAIIESRKPIASFSRAALPWGLQLGDRIERRCDGSSFEITAVKPDGVSRVTVDLVQLGLAEQ